MRAAVRYRAWKAKARITAKKSDKTAANYEFEKSCLSVSGFFTGAGVLLLKPSSLSSSGIGVFGLPSISIGVSVISSYWIVATVALIFPEP